MTEINGANRGRDVMGDDVNYLRPDILETTNRILLDIDEILNPDPEITWPKQDNPIAIAGYYFNKKTRTFHSHLVWGGDGWKSGKIEGRNLKILKFKIQKVLKKEFGAELEQLREHPELPMRSDAPYLRILADLFAIKQSDSKKEQSRAAQLDSSGRRLAALAKCLLESKLSQADLMQAYAHIAVGRDEFLSGIMYQCLDDRKLLSDVDRDRLSFLTVDVDLKSEGYQTKCKPWLWRKREFEVGVSIAERIPQLKKTLDLQHRMRRTIWGCLQNRLYREGLENEFKQWAKRKKADETRLGHAALVVPVFDLWDAGRGYGALWGVLVCSFANEEARALYLTDASQERLRELLLEAERVSDAYFEAGLAKLVGEEIRPPYDLIELFVQRLHWIQDWERVTVCKKDGTDPLYCYRHVEPTGGGIEWRWERCKQGDSKMDGNGRCGSCRKAEGRRVFKWSDLDHEIDHNPILNPALVKELREQEESLYRDYDIEFEFPSVAVVPFENGGIKRHLRHEIARQHIAALRALLPKVYTRRAALRSAVSAIMGRNMSHNIGSHVLARYTSKIRTDDPPAEADNNKLDHRSVFLSYLQRRMDFLAEIATSDKAFWEQPLSLKEQLGRLDYDNQKKQFRDGAEPIVLSYITGKESISANVEYAGSCKHVDGKEGDGLPNYDPRDKWFACPGGEVGVHALFVILENIIRNSARHSESEKPRSLIVFVDESGCSEDLIKLIVVDPETLLESDGRKSGTEKKWKSDPEENKLREQLQEELTQVEKGQHSDYEDGKDRKRIERLCLHNEINSILEGEPILDGSGQPNPQYWGVREMQVCAHYLRGLGLSELECPRDSKYPVFKADVHSNGDGTYCLRYELYLQRAKLAVVLANEDADLGGPR